MNNKEGNYPEMFEAAETKMMAKDDVVAYSDSLAKLRDNERSYQYAEDRGIEIGEERGVKIGKLEIAKKMMSLGMPMEDITKLTGLSAAEIG